MKKIILGIFAITAMAGAISLTAQTPPAAPAAPATAASAAALPALTADEIVNKHLEALGGKDAGHAQAGIESLLDQIGAFDSDKAAVVAAGASQRPAQFLQTRVLFTLYNANRHRRETLGVLADSMPFCELAFSPLAPRLVL